MYFKYFGRLTILNCFFASEIKIVRIFFASDVARMAVFTRSYSNVQAVECTTRRLFPPKLPLLNVSNVCEIPYYQAKIETFTRNLIFLCRILLENSCNNGNPPALWTCVLVVSVFQFVAYFYNRFSHIVMTNFYFMGSFLLICFCFYPNIKFYSYI